SEDREDPGGCEAGGRDQVGRHYLAQLLLRQRDLEAYQSMRVLHRVAEKLARFGAGVSAWSSVQSRLHIQPQYKKTTPQPRERPEPALSRAGLWWRSGRRPRRRPGP